MSNLDILRFVAAGVVVLYHYTYRGIQGGKIPGGVDNMASSVTRYGYLGVDAFFVISGIVIAYSAMNKPWASFVSSRVARLWPALIAAATLTALLVVCVSPSWRPSVSMLQYLANLTMFPQVLGEPYVEPVYWTLWVEIKFYAFIAILTVFGLTPFRLLVLAWGWMVAEVLLIAASMEYGIYSAALSAIVQPSYAHYFIFGITIYLLRTRQYVVSAAVLGGAAAAVAVIVSAQTARQLSQAQGASYDPRVAQVVVAGGLAVLLYASLSPGVPKLANLFEFAGRLTYPLYLIHASMGYAVIDKFSPALGALVSTLMAIAVSMLVAYAINRLIEIPFGPKLRRAMNVKLSGVSRLGRSWL